MNIYDIKVKNRNDEDVSLKKYKGKVLLVINSATGCGFTPQYEAIEKLYKKYNKDGFEVLDFPCNQFGHQAPGTDDEIHEFCTAKYDTTFDQFKKIDVNGENESPLFTYLKSAIKTDEIKGFKNKLAMKGVEKLSTSYKKEGDIKWNFTKFLLDRNGKVIRRLSPIEDPIKLESDIINLINKED